MDAHCRLFQETPAVTTNGLATEGHPYNYPTDNPFRGGSSWPPDRLITRQRLKLQRRQRDLHFAYILTSQKLNHRLLNLRVSQHTLVSRIVDHDVCAVS